MLQLSGFFCSVCMKKVGGPILGVPLFWSHLKWPEFWKLPYVLRLHSLTLQDVRAGREQYRKPDYGNTGSPLKRTVV